MHTPWGVADTCVTLRRGVHLVDTPSHGGVLVARRLAEQELTAEARRIGERFGEYYAFEEDCAYAVVAFEQVDWFVGQYVDSAGHPHSAAQIREHAEGVLRRWYPEYFGEPSVRWIPSAYIPDTAAAPCYRVTVVAQRGVGGLASSAPVVPDESVPGQPGTSEHCYLVSCDPLDLHTCLRALRSRLDAVEFPAHGWTRARITALRRYGPPDWCVALVRLGGQYERAHQAGNAGAVGDLAGAMQAFAAQMIVASESGHVYAATSPRTPEEAVERGRCLIQRLRRRQEVSGALLGFARASNADGVV